MDLSAPRRRIVVAAGEGVVIGRVEVRGLGPQLVLQHGDSLQTVYANAEMFLVDVGDRVRAGQVIALVGQGHEGLQPHLHFQVLRGGRPVDPRDWVPELFPY
jgi:murein DD-endopeptidase MepM/ murein hydrolase activator NlpD